MATVADAHQPRPCDVEGCDRPHKSLGFCEPHYRRFKASGDPLSGRPIERRCRGRVCDIEGCGKAHQSLGLCAAHYSRYRIHGDPLGFSPRAVKRVEPKPAIERLLALVEIDADTGCWPFQGKVNPSGYGLIRGNPVNDRRGKVIAVHRLSYEFFVGPIPNDCHIDHVWDRGCRHRTCVNPDHLEAVTPEENVRRAIVAQAARRAS